MNELVNKLVMVHPRLTHDPVNQQGNVGIIAHVVPENDEIFVRFEDRTIGLYSKDALLIMKPPAFIFDQYSSGSLHFTYQELQTIKQVHQLVQSNENQLHRKAIKMLSQNEAAMDACMLSLQDWVDRGMAEFWNQGRNTGRTR